MGFFSGIVSAVKSIVSSVKGVISAVGKALTTGNPSDVNNAIAQIDNTINEVDKLIKLLEGPKKQKTTTGAEDSGILPTWDEVKGFFQRKEDEISDYIIKEKNYIGAVIYKKAEAVANNPFLHPVVSRVEMLYNFEKNTLLRTMAESNGQVGPDGMVYATEDQAKLADAGAGQLTGEAVGGVIGVAINGIKSYNIIKNGEKLSSEFVAGSGIGSATGKGAGDVESEVNSITKGTGNPDYSSIRAYDGINVEEIPVEYRADPRLTTEMEFKGKGKSGTNAAGWERNAGKHFEDLLDNNPEYWSEQNVTKIENGTVPVVDDTFVEHFTQYNNQIGDKLIHHHIGGGGQAAAVPQSLHPGFGGIHNVEKTFGIRGNDPLTEIGQTFTGSPSK